MSQTNMKEKGKVPKIHNFAYASPSFEQIYSQPLSKFSDNRLSTHQSDNHTTNHLPVINSDTDRFLHQSNNSYWLPQSARSNYDSGILNKFSSNFQDVSQTINQYLGSFKGSGYTNLNYEDLSQFVFDPKVPGFLNTFPDAERFKKLADLSSDSVMSKTTNHIFKMANKNTGSLTTRALSHATDNTSTFTAQVNKVFDSDKKPQPKKPGILRGDSLTDRNRTKSDLRSSNKDSYVTEATPRKQSNYAKPGRLLLTEESQLSENKTTTRSSRDKRPVLKLVKPKEPIVQKATLGLDLPPLNQLVSPPKTNWISSSANPKQERINIIPVRIETEPERASIIIKDFDLQEEEDEGIPLERKISSNKAKNGGKTTKAKSEENPVNSSPGLKRDSKVHINLKDVKRSPTGPSKLGDPTPRRGLSVQMAKTPRMSKINVLSLNLNEGEMTNRNTTAKPKSIRSIEWSSVVVDLERGRPSDPERQGEKGSLQILLNSEKTPNSKTNLKKEDKKIVSSNAIPKGSLKEKFRKKVLAVKLGGRFISSISQAQNKATPKVVPKQSLSPESSPLRRGNTGLPSFSLPQKGKSASSQPSKKTPTKEEHTSSSKKHKKSSPRKGSSADKEIPKEKKKESTKTHDTKANELTIKISTPEVTTKPVLEHKSTIKTGKRSSRRDSVKTSHHHHHHSSNGSSPDLKSATIHHRLDPKNPKSWFDFQTRKMPHHKPKKVRNLRNVTDPVPPKNIFEEAEMEFISAFDLTLKSAIKHSSAASPLLRKPTEESDFISRNYLREQSKASAPLEELLRQASEDEETTKPSYTGEGRKTLNYEGDSTQISKPQPSQPPQSGGAILIEDTNKNLVPKTYSHRDGIITILINPPIEEAVSAMEETGSPSSGNTQKVLENLEPTDPATTELPSKVLHFKFDVNHRKALEEESSFFSEDPSRYDVSTLEQAYRKKAEEFFQVEDIYESKMENLNIKSQKLRIRSNFLTFVEKVVVKATEKWALCELITSYIPQLRKDQTSTEYSDSSVSIKIKNLYDWKYKPKSFYITLDPFRLDFIFLLTVDALTLKTIIISQSDVGDEVAFEEDEDTHEKRLGCQTLVFSTGEEYSTKSKLNDPTEAKRVLRFNSIMVRVNADTILGMKKAFYFSAEDTFRSKPGTKRLVTKNYHNLLGRISMILENTTDMNWDYIKKSILSIYEYLIYGNFEIKKPMGAEIVVKEIKEPEPEDELQKILEENARQSKKRETYIGVGKKMLRTVSNLKQALTQNQNQIQVQQSPKHPPLMSTDTLPLDPQKVSIIEEDKGEYDSDTKIVTNDSLRAAFSLPKQTTKPALKQKECQDNALRKPLTNIEKSKTIIGFDTPKKKKDPIMANIIQKAQQMKATSKLPLDSPTKDPQGRLLIPDSLGKLSRHGTSGSPSNGPRESRLNTVEEKGLKKFGTNISVTPSSDQSTPVKEENGLFFQNQSTIHSQLTRERTKVLDKSAKSKKEPSHSRSPNREKDEPTSQILHALLPKPKSEAIHARKSIVLSVQPRKFDGNKGAHPISENQSPAMKHRPAPRKVDDEKGLENYLFNAVYCNQFFELREIMVLYPKNILGVHDEEMNTLLIAAAQSGHKDIVQLFLNLGCDVNAQNKQGNTALHVSLAYHHYDVADLLVKHGAKQSIANARGKTAWDQ